VLQHWSGEEDQVDPKQHGGERLREKGAHLGGSQGGLSELYQ